MNEIGERAITAELCGIGTPSERLVVTRADAHGWATAAIVKAWLTPGKWPSVRVYGDGDVIEFGSHGEGVGVVRYRIGDIPRDDDPVGWTDAGHPLDQWYRGLVELTRVDEEW